ncbi:BZ3500_MvSof-1268-A1-R1_Chr9g10526 [Microbotryum saponariae]|uniref:BZ3500_MvSof-1268-A1-R1_Chr9g10526 protein n=1 Tax=Microbotryum saponariae TaxID=289078 RepID=A0A2X0MCU8_9BASI|nr:BZ3501_MvSof-1269-A2-R1_Chr9g10275 [Microbotryum saponariae]SDA00241.1 BZ3500_MvSof-1268-A1-R1_Chr9g10526 [Microbotryum saponariae]
MSGYLPPGYRGPVNSNPNPPDGEARISIYGYRPSNIFAYVATVIFGLSFIVHFSYLMISRGTRTFQILIVCGCAMEVGGYVVRILSHKNPFIVSYFVAQYFLIVVAPCFFSGTFYLALSNALGRLPPNESRTLLPFGGKKLVIIFVIADTITTIIQIAGAALIGVAESSRTRGDPSSITPQQANDILLSGLALQCASFLCFYYLLITVAVRASKMSPRSLRKTFLAILSITSFLVLTRTVKPTTCWTLRFGPIFSETYNFLSHTSQVYRLAETAEGIFGYASSNEWLFGLLEFAPVALAVLFWAAVPLHKVLPEQSPQYHEGWEAKTEA